MALRAAALVLVSSLAAPAAMADGAPCQLLGAAAAFATFERVESTAQGCVFANVVVKRPTPLPGFAAREVIVDGIDADAFVTMAPPPHARVVVHDGAVMISTGRPNIDFIYGESAPRFDAALDYTLSPAGDLRLNELSFHSRRLGDAKLVADGKSDKAAGKVQNAVGGLRDALKGASKP